MPRPPRDRHKTGNQRERNPAHQHGPRKMKLNDEPPPPIDKLRRGKSARNSTD